MFRPWFPTATAGNGRIRANSANDGAGQGRGSRKRIGSCQHCGMVQNFRAIDMSGGDLTGNGSRSSITKTTVTGTTLAGASISETFGNAINRRGAGCALCGSKDAAKQKPYMGRLGSSNRGPGI